MSHYVFDIEANGLLKECDQMWCLVTYNMDTEEVVHYLEGDTSWQKVFDEAKIVAGHNICGYDLPVLEKLFNYKLPKTCKIRDTLLFSQILNYKRFASGRHGLETWGVNLGFHKHEFSDFSKYSQEMLDYCIQDVKLNVKVYKLVYHEFLHLYGSNKKIAQLMLAEQAASAWNAKAELVGWPFDESGGKALYAIFEQEMESAYAALSAKLGTKTVAVDKAKGVVAVKTPRWTKQGCYDAHTANYFKVDPFSGYEGEERVVEGEYCRVKFEELSLDSVADVKIFLYRAGWEPTTWNVKRNEATKKNEKTSPKITADSLEFLGGDGLLYTAFASVKARASILKTWLASLDEEDNLHGGAMLIGTPSMRSTHTLIVNVPSADATWGPEMRRLFQCKPGWKLIGCDSKGNQVRGLAHFMKNEAFQKTLVEGDIHQYNADVLTKVLLAMGVVHTVPRSAAKRILYAFLFGASGAKLWSYVFGVMNKEKGNKMKSLFMKSVPGFKELIDTLENIYGSTSKSGDGYIPSIAGNRIYVDSFHKLLVYLLQSTEKATCSAALMLTAQRLEEAKIPYLPCIYYHDEINFQTPEEYAEEAKAIGLQAFADGPKLFDISIMAGDAKIGETWYDVH